LWGRRGLSLQIKPPFNILVLGHFFPSGRKVEV
jgi:hypothetical protein